MRYVHLPALNSVESRLLAAEYGKQYEPSGGVTIGPTAVLDRRGSELVDVLGEPLAIHPDSGSWAFLERGEAAAFDAVGREPMDLGQPGVVDLVAALYRRGLIGINGQRAVTPQMFDDGPNHVEAHLVELLVTERCNLGCVYCLAGTNAKMPTMTTETAERAVDLAFAMRDAPVIGFEFSGGEPFLRFDLMRHTVDYIERHPARDGRPVYLSVQSNGTLLTAERVAWLVAHDVTIGLSMDGQPWAQNASRPMLGGGASYDALMRGIDLLRSANVAFGALVVLNRANIDSPESLCSWLTANDILSVKLNPVAFLGTAREAWDVTGVTQDEIVRYFGDFIDLIAAGRYPVLEANLATMLQHLVSKRRRVRCLRGDCGAGDTFQAVSADGTVYPCGRATQSAGLALGHVADPTLRDLAQPAAGNRHILAIRERRPRTLDGCAQCAYRELCQAGCSAQAFERYGTVRHRTPECHFFKTMYPELMHRISFDFAALDAFHRLGYFGGPAELVHHDVLPLGVT